MDQEMRDIKTSLAKLVAEVGAFRAEQVQTLQKVTSLQRTVESIGSPNPVAPSGSGGSPGPIGSSPGAPAVPLLPVGVGILPHPPMPPRFSGDPRNYSSFITQCKLHYLNKPQIYGTAESKVLFMLMNLEGNALAWATPLIDRDDPLLHNYPLFCDTFASMFERRQEGQLRKDELLGLRQGSQETLQYVTKFQLLASETKWADDTLVRLFHRGLNDELKDVLAQILPLPNTLAPFIELVLQLDQRFGERRKERRRNPISRVFYRSPPEKRRTEVDEEEPMQIGGVREPLSKQERERRRVERLCFYCGAKGHGIAQCPKRPGEKSGGNA